MTLPQNFVTNRTKRPRSTSTTLPPHSQALPSLQGDKGMPEAVIVDTIRTPIGRAFKGSLAQLRPEEMGAFVVDQLLERNPELDPALVEDLICGCGFPQGLQGFNIGRIISLLSQLPQTVTGATIARYCSSSL